MQEVLYEAVQKVPLGLLKFYAIERAVRRRQRPPRLPLDQSVSPRGGRAL
jgi:hypothetical protein